MIERLKEKYIDDVMSIWLNENLRAHSFVDQDYFKSNFNTIKEILPKSEVYVYKDKDIIKGFVGINEGYIEGIFVDSLYKRQGIGSELLYKVKQIYNVLHLNVFVKNESAYNFYIKHNFKMIEKRYDEDTLQYEYLMEYKKTY